MGPMMVCPAGVAEVTLEPPERAERKVDMRRLNMRKQKKMGEEEEEEEEGEKMRGAKGR